MTDQPNGETFSARLSVNQFAYFPEPDRVSMTASADGLACEFSMALQGPERVRLAQVIGDAATSYAPVRIDITFLGDDSTEATDTH